MRLHKRMGGKLGAVIDQIEHGHHVFRAYWKNAFLKQYEKCSTLLRNELSSNNLSDFSLRMASLPDLALHLGFHCAHRFIHCRSCDILNHLVAGNRQIDAERLWNSEYKPIANLPVADRFAVFLPACIQTCR